MLRNRALIFLLLIPSILSAQTINDAIYGRHVWTKYSWTNANVVALGANLTGELTVATLPALTIVKRAVVRIDTACAGTTTLTVSVGPDGTELGYVLAADAKAAANTTYGALIATVGALLSDGLGSLPSVTGTTVIKALFTSTVQNLDAVTTCTGTIWLETALLP